MLTEGRLRLTDGLSQTQLTVLIRERQPTECSQRERQYTECSQRETTHPSQSHETRGFHSSQRAHRRIKTHRVVARAAGSPSCMLLLVVPCSAMRERGRRGLPLLCWLPPTLLRRHHPPYPSPKKCPSVPPPTTASPFLPSPTVTLIHTHTSPPPTNLDSLSPLSLPLRFTLFFSLPLAPTTSVSPILCHTSFHKAEAMPSQALTTTHN